MQFWQADAISSGSEYGKLQPQKFKINIISGHNSKSLYNSIFLSLYAELAVMRSK
jgi:hypothetical protein